MAIDNNLQIQINHQFIEPHIYPQITIRFYSNNGIITPILYLQGRRIIEPWEINLREESAGGGDCSA